MGIFEIFRQPPEQHLFVQARTEAIKTFASYSCTGLLDRVSKKNRRSTEFFLGRNCLELNNYLQFLYSKEFFPLVKLSIDFHKGDKRHATKDPYYKHIFYTGYLCNKLAKKYHYNDSQKKIFVAAALLHDTIEMRRANHLQFSEEDLLKHLTENSIKNDEAEKIITLVSFLTPADKDNSKLNVEEWRAKKRENFSRIMDAEVSDESSLGIFVIAKRIGIVDNVAKPSDKKLLKELLEMAKHINIADDTAIIREIINDVESGNDGPNIVVFNHKSFADRITNYQNRITIIGKKYPNHPLLPQLKEDFGILVSKLTPTE